MRNSMSADFLSVNFDDEEGRSELDSETPAAGPSKRQKNTEEETSLKVPDPAPPPQIRIRNPCFEIIDVNNLSSPCSVDPAPITDNPVPSSAEKGIQSDFGMLPRRVTDFGVGAAGVPSNTPTVSWQFVVLYDSRFALSN